MRLKKQQPEKQLLWLFWIFAFFCLGAAIAAPDRDRMNTGLIQICSRPVSTLTNFFAPFYGGYAGTFLNIGLVSLLCILIFYLPGAAVNDGSVVAFFLTAGLCARGTHVLNFLPGIPGVFLYCLLKKKSIGSQANVMIFSSGISLLFSELLLYYPGDVWHEPTGVGLLLTLAGGCAVGYLTAVIMSWNLVWSNTLSMYTAALPVGILSIGLHAVFYQLPGISRPVTDNMGSVGNWLISNVFLLAISLLFILTGWLALGGSVSGYRELLKDKRWNTDYSTSHAVGNIAINLGCLGLIGVIYYNLVGAMWSAVTFGSVLCMICTGCRGNKPTTAVPILLGYLTCSFLACFFAEMTGVEGLYAGSAPGLVTGASFAVGLGPIVSRYGWKAGTIAGVMHYCLVINVLPVIGTFCMYHGGFTAALVSFLLIPVLNRLMPAPDNLSAEI